jgi:hypothetical protein
MKDKWEKIWKEAFMTRSRHYSGFLLEELGKLMKTPQSG